MQAISLTEKTTGELVQLIVSGNAEDRNFAAEEIIQRGYEGAEQMIPLLAQQDKEIQDTVIWALCEMNDNTDSLLIDALSHKDASIRESTEYILGIKKRVDAIPCLITLLKDESEAVRQSAAWAMVKIGEPSVPYLIKALLDNSIIVQELSLWSLEKIGEPAVEPLLESFTAFSPDTRIMIENLLVSVSDGMEELFIKHLDSDDIEFRLSILRILGQMRSELTTGVLMEYLQSDHRPLRQQAVLSLSRADDSAIPVIFRAISNGQIPVDDDIISLVTRIRKPAVPYLFEFLCDPNVDLRIMAAKALGIIGDRRSIEPLINSLDDSNSRVREIAARALGILKHPAATKPLMKLLLNPDHDAAISNTIHALADMADEKLVCEAAENFESLKPVVQQRVIQLLGNYRCEKSENIMLQSLNSDNEDTRRYAVRSLGKCGSERSVEPLKKVIIEDINIISNEARSSLKLILDRLKRDNL